MPLFPKGKAADLKVFELCLLCFCENTWRLVVVLIIHFKVMRVKIGRNLWGR